MTPNEFMSRVGHLFSANNPKGSFLKVS